MAGSTFQTNPFDLSKLLDDCQSGVIQLPDFQRSWVWDEDRIKSLIASVSRAFPVGALMDRQKRILALIEQATGKPAYSGNVPEEGEDVEVDEDTVEAKLTIAAE